LGSSFSISIQWLGRVALKRALAPKEVIAKPAAAA
jgi:hypothetical protein